MNAKDMEPIIRILLRYLAGFLVAKGLANVDVATILTSDPQVVSMLAQAAFALVGLVLGLASEFWYWLARKTGRAT